MVILVIMALGFHDWKLTSRRFAAYAMSFASMDGRFLCAVTTIMVSRDERLEQLTGGCRVHDGLVYFHNKAKVTVCHGHILGLSKTLDLVRTANNVNHMLAQFREDLLDKELQPSVIAYDIANMIEAALARQGLRGLSTAWEGIYQYRAMLAEQLLKLARSSNQADETTWKMIAGLVGTHDSLQVAGMLGVACGGWASLFGSHP